MIVARTTFSALLLVALTGIACGAYADEPAAAAAPMANAIGTTSTTTAATADVPATADTSTTTASTTSPSKWKIAFGPGVIVSPAYPGSSKLKVYPFPALDISYDDRFFSQGPDVLGVNVVRDPNYHLGAALSLDFQSRSESDDPRLRGLGDVHWTPKLKLFGDYTWWAFTGSVAMYQDIGGNRQGKTIVSDLYASLPLDNWLFSVGPGFTWADAEYTRTFFGVSQQQSAASKLPTFDTGSGIRDIHMNFYVSHDFSKHWTSSISIVAGRLQHYAADSPITSRRFELNSLASVNYRY
ncbi:Outer membrane scaffolding protein for murein synthesis, MipA/OmpV family [Paraburkholderia megapolitana]|uniref:Outer membrane scaffolding protein for murein synthesis, MipA/OmpV family n=2 Tax=Paraburkholderia megapolitana TaxID=420953 RepID=A0A1I3EVA5_9BURK|nr:Outer membrane scaffolding protein for murein synthesis, MipA/OmpV family [Paraburkholderia megapolitana]